VLTHASLGPAPSLHQLRIRSRGGVRRLRRYYGRVWLLRVVHHRLRLIAFPMRTAGQAVGGQPGDLPVPAQGACVHAGVCDRAGSTGHSRWRAPSCGLSIS